MEIKKSEDCLIFIGITPEFIKMSRVNDAISLFMNKKQEVDSSDRFNFIIFQNNGPTYLDHFTFDPNLILKTLKSLEKKIVKANIAGGIFVAITFIIDVFKKISEKVFRLIILTDDGAYKIPFHYIPILEDLIDKVKGMPFFIDIVRINAFDIQERLNLTELTKCTNGMFHDITSIKELNPILTSLSEKKYVKVPAYYMKKKTKRIINRNIPFYVNLAEDPLIFDTIGSCAVCFQRDNIGMIKCPACETIVHKKCWAQWAKMSNIGISHVFRCHNCFNLLKLDEKFVLDVQEGRIPMEEKAKKFTRRDMVNYLRELEEKQKPKMIQVNDPMAIENETIEIKTENQQNSTNKRKKQQIKIIICPNCSKFTTSNNKQCPNCYFPF